MYTGPNRPGIVISKYGHIKSPINGLFCLEAGHPIPDNNTFRATATAKALVENLTEQDTVLFLLSGGGSALFEQPLISTEEFQDITNQLLSSGADIIEINTVRKRSSSVKDGRFAKLCEPAHVFAIVLSDVLGDSADMIASRSAAFDRSTCCQALNAVSKYKLIVSDEAIACLKRETLKRNTNVMMPITGSVKHLCEAAARRVTEALHDTVITK